MARYMFHEITVKDYFKESARKNRTGIMIEITPVPADQRKSADPESMQHDLQQARITASEIADALQASHSYKKRKEAEKHIKLFIDFIKDRIECDYCEGSGLTWQREECADCEGKGYIENK